MKEEKLYYSAPYLRSTEAEIVKIDGNHVFFDKTVFYPEGGGQRGDSGSFDGLKITDTVKIDGRSAHVFLDTSSLYVGEKGCLSLDWENRYMAMQMHSAQHLISAVLYNSFGIRTLAVHLSDGFVTIETDREIISEEEIEKVEDECASIIREGRKIFRKEMSREKASEYPIRRSIKVDGDDISLVFIDGVDVVPCGGVHVASTCEIKEISYDKSEIIRNHVRLYFFVSEKAVSMRRAEHSVIKSLCSILSSPLEKLVCESERRRDEAEAMKKTIKSLESRLALSDLESNRGKKIIYTSLDLDCFINHLEKSDDEFFIINGERFIYKGRDEVFLTLKSRGVLKGGGKNGFYQGKVIDLKELSFLGKDL